VLGGVAGGVGQRDRVADDRPVDEDLLGRGAVRSRVSGWSSSRTRTPPSSERATTAASSSAARVAHDELEQEAVGLGLGSG
jgi:hypothetical protein